MTFLRENKTNLIINENDALILFSFEGEILKNIKINEKIPIIY